MNKPRALLAEGRFLEALMDVKEDRPVVTDALHERLDPVEVEHLLNLSELLEQTWEQLPAAQGVLFPREL